MKTKTTGLALALCFFGAAACFADPQMGTWKLNESKSKIMPGTRQNTTAVYEAVGKQVKVTVDGTNTDGKTVHTVWTGKFNGKDYPVIGDPTSDACSYTKVNDRTLDFAIMTGGKVAFTGRIVVSADGKSRVLTMTGTTARGEKFKNTIVYDKIPH